MPSTWSHSLKLSLCVAAVCALGVVNAQTPAPAAAPAAQAAAPQAQPHEGKKPHHMQRHHRSHKEGQYGKQGHHGKYATPEEREAAAARAEERSGRMHRGEGMDQYQRNALARCEVFRDPEDRRSCVERVRTAPVSGSVKEGGVLREYTEQVPVRP